jgi:proton glutamate symport protein
MKKFKLHWQILVALILAIIYGIVFPTSYCLTEKSFRELEKSKMSSVYLGNLKRLEGQKFEIQQDFLAAVNNCMTGNDDRIYQEEIISAAYYNKPVSYISWMGDLFLRALRMIIIPLIFSSLAAGVASIGSSGNLGRLGLKTLSYYIITSLIAILTGLFMVNIFKPGVGADLNFSQQVEGLIENQRSFKDTLLHIVPDNIFNAMNNGDMLAIIFFSVLFGFFITRVRQSYADALTKALNAIFEVMMKITMFVILFAPFGVFGIVARVVSDQDDLINLMSKMGLYMATVLIGLFIHTTVTLPLIVYFVGKARPFKHMNNLSTALFTAFSTASSNATLPLSMNGVEKNSGVSNKITSFVLPLGATINMNGTALYECVAAIFIAQAYGIEMTLVQQLIIVFTALLASIGAAGIPMAGLVMMTVVLNAVGLPLEGIGLILAVDRILDMFRTVVNVWGDCCGAVVIAKSEGEKLLV